MSTSNAISPTTHGVITMTDVMLDSAVGADTSVVPESETTGTATSGSGTFYEPLFQYDATVTDGKAAVKCSALINDFPQLWDVWRGADATVVRLKCTPATAKLAVIPARRRPWAILRSSCPALYFATASPQDLLGKNIRVRPMRRLCLPLLEVEVAGRRVSGSAARSPMKSTEMKVAQIPSARRRAF